MAGQAVFALLLLLLGELCRHGVALRGGKGPRRWLLCSVLSQSGLPWAPGGAALSWGGVCGRCSPAKPCFGLRWRSSALHCPGGAASTGLGITNGFAQRGEEYDQIFLFPPKMGAKIQSRGVIEPTGGLVRQPQQALAP